MIASFQSKALRRFFETGETRRLSVQNPLRIGRVLRALDVADAPEALDLPGFRFHLLTGEQKGRYAVDVSGNWRITFGWQGDDAIDVNLEDYH